MHTKNSIGEEELVLINECDKAYYINKRGELYNRRYKRIGTNSEYLMCNLPIGGRRVLRYVHRLVAEMFIENPENKPCVNHIDGDKKNNNYKNLEWVTHKENITHSILLGTFHINGHQNNHTKKRNMDAKNNQYSFRNGLGQVPNGKIPECRDELMAALKIKTRASYYRRLNGTIIPRLDQVQAIEAVFAKFGITKNIWGE